MNGLKRHGTVKPHLSRQAKFSGANWQQVKNVFHFPCPADHEQDWQLYYLVLRYKCSQIFFSLSPFAPENLVSRDRFGRPVPGQPAQSGLNLIGWCLLTGFLPLSTTASIYLLYMGNRHRVNPGFIRSRKCVPMATTSGSSEGLYRCVKIFLQQLPKVRRHRASSSLYAVLSTCPLHTNSGCGKERRKIFGPW